MNSGEESSRCGRVEMNPTSLDEDMGSLPGQRPGVAVTVAEACSCSSYSTPSLETAVCLRCGPESKKKNEFSFEGGKDAQFSEEIQTEISFLKNQNHKKTRSWRPTWGASPADITENVRRPSPSVCDGPGESISGNRPQPVQEASWEHGRPSQEEPHPKAMFATTKLWAQHAEPPPLGTLPGKHTTTHEHRPWLSEPG